MCVLGLDRSKFKSKNLHLKKAAKINPRKMIILYSLRKVNQSNKIHDTEILVVGEILKTYEKKIDIKIDFSFFFIFNV